MARTDDGSTFVGPNNTGRSAPERTARVRRPYRVPSYWVVASGDRVGTRTVRCAEGGRALPVFSSREETEAFLRFWVLTGAARPVAPSELASLLLKPGAAFEKVALDPSPEILIKGLVHLVSLDREEFVEALAP